MSVTTEKVIVQVSADNQVTLVTSLASSLGAASSAAVAEAAAAAALASETAAGLSETAAVASAAAALVSEGNADTSEANAAASAAAALVSEGNADTSADASATSASNALTSANNADISEAAAAASAAAALASQNAAAASAASAATATETLVEGGTLDASFASLKSSGDIVLAGTKKFYIDGVGGVGGDTYLTESSANVMDFFAGANKTLSLTATSATVAGTISAVKTGIATLTLDASTVTSGYSGGVALDDVGMLISTNSVARGIRMTIAGTTYARLNNLGLVLNPTAKLWLDGAGDTYITESSANVLDVYAGANKTLSVTAAGATVAATADVTFPGTPFVLTISDNSTAAANVGGGILFHGKYAAVGTATTFAIISGVKANATDGNYEGVLNFGVRANGGAGNITRMSLSPTTLTVIGGSDVTSIGGISTLVVKGGDTNNDVVNQSFATSAGGTIAVLSAKATTTGAYPLSVGELHIGVQNGGSTNDIVTVSNTGVAITGALSATGNATFSGVTNAAQGVKFTTSYLGSASDYHIGNYLTNLVYNAPTGGGHVWAINNGDKMTLSATGLTLLGIADTGDVTATSGAVGMRIRYSASDFLNIFGSMYSSGATMLGYGVRSSTVVGNAFLSTSAAASHPRGALTMDNTLRFFQANASTLAVGATASLTETFTITSNGDLITLATKKHYLDGGGDTYLVESSANVMDFYAAGVNVLRATHAGGVGTVTVSGNTIAALAVTSTGACSYLTLNNSGGATKTGTLLTITGDTQLRSESISFKNYDASAAYASFGTTGAVISSGRLQVSADAVPPSNYGVEIGHNGTTGAIISYNRTTAAYKALNINALTTNLQISGVTRVGVSSTGVAVTGDVTSTGVLTSTDANLSAIDRTVFAATIVDTFLYDTEKDSDGGAWRKRCSHTSWENETLSGNWLGSAANEAAARAISGATTGSYYYDTTAAAFYTLNAGSGKTLTYRGNVRQFPAQVLITVESTRVVLWDLTQAGAPMWMVFASTGSLFYAGNNQSCAAAMNGILCVGNATAALSIASFAGDRMYAHLSTTKHTLTATVGTRNIAWASAGSTASGAIVNNIINDVAMTVLPNAPVDVATGLPVPTIAVATDGGVSVIKDDGNVWDITATSYGISTRVGFRRDNKLFFTMDAATSSQRHLHVYTIPTADISNANGYQKGSASEFYANDPTWGPDLVVSPSYASNTVFSLAKGAVGSQTGIAVLKDNPATPAKGMVAYITKDYNSGWMVGDIRGAWLADTVAETITGTELVTNGGLTVNAAGWTTLNGAGLAHGANGVTITNAGASYGGLYQALTGLTVGKKYTVTMKVTGCYGVPARWGVQDTIPTTASGIGETTVDATLIHTFTATATTHYLVVGNRNDSGGYNTFGSISCKLADVDRSVKAKGLQAFGSLTKAAVASGAALMGYSGFSAANYFQQPYNADLDFGTGDFCVMGWVNVNSAATTVILNRALSGGTGGIQISNLAGGSLRVHGSASSAWTEMFTTSSGVIPANTWTFIAVFRSGSTVYCYVNGVLITSAANTTNLTYVGAVLHVGGNLTLDNFANGPLALWRAGATAPSAEQIKHIYQTERPLFEANAYCCLAGASNAVAALAYDEETDLLHVGTSYGRSAFKGLVRVSSEATPVGAITALAAGAGVIVQGGATAVDVYVPAYTLREELLRDAEQMAKFGQNLIAHDFTATASQTTFTLPVGWEIVAVYQQGAIKRETTSWTRSFDGFKWSAVLGTGATVSDWISILAKRV